MKTSTLVTLSSMLSMLVLQTVAGVEKAEPGKLFIYKHTNGEPQEMEIYFPEGHDPALDRRPCLLLFHGGGWGNGDLSTFRYDCQYFASRGIVAITANYFMHSKESRQNLPDGVSRKQACVTDAKSAIRWVKQRAGDLGVDPGKLVVGGGSAGGHISLLATLNSGLNDPADPLEFDTSVAGYVLFNPALSPGDKQYPQIDALNYLSSGFPPAVVFFGTKDKWKPGWDAAMEQLKALGAGDRVTVWLAEGEEHAFFNKQPWKDLTIIQADRFLKSLGVLEGEPTMKIPQGGARFVKEES